MPKGDREKLKADIEDGYTRVSNLLLEALALANLSGVQKGICLYLIRRTYSWGQKSARIKLQDFAEACGTDKSYISRQLKELEKKNIVLRLDATYGQVPEFTLNTKISGWTCLDLSKLEQNTQEGLYKHTTDECCTNVQGLDKSTTEVLYKCTIQGLHKSTTVTPSEATDNKASESPKERFKESLKKIHTYTASDVYQDEEIHEQLKTIANPINIYWPKFIADCMNKGITRDVALLAIKRDVNKGRRTFTGIEKRLKDWIEKQLFTLRQVEDNDAKVFDKSAKKPREPSLTNPLERKKTDNELYMDKIIADIEKVGGINATRPDTTS